MKTPFYDTGASAGKQDGIKNLKKELKLTLKDALGETLAVLGLAHLSNLA